MAYDYEYQRNGVSNLFMLLAPLEEWRRVEVADRRTRRGWARVIRKLVDEDYPEKERIVLLMDNLNTHHPASLYEAFEPAEARRIAQRLEIHYTPKQGSWLNIVEIETGGAGAAVPGPPDTQPGNPGTENKGMGEPAESSGDSGGRLALFNRGRPHQAQVHLPINTIVVGCQSLLYS